MNVLRDAGDAAAGLPLVEGVTHVVQAVASAADRVRYEPGDEAILGFVAHVALAPRNLNREQLEPLRASGHSDRDIFDIVQVVSCFSYMNRLADALGVVLLPHQYAWAEQLLGEQALKEHLAWGSMQLEG